MVWCQPTQRSVKETSRKRLTYEALGCQIPSMGLWMRQLLATLCVTSSLALVALGGYDLSEGFCLRTLSFGRPHGNRGTRLRYGWRIP
jgi:hypothetical protein